MAKMRKAKRKIGDSDLWVVMTEISVASRDDVCSASFCVGFTGQEPEYEGFIKWDGCLELSTQPRHFCGMSGMRTHVEILAKIFECAIELMPESEEEIRKS